MRMDDIESMKLRSIFKPIIAGVIVFISLAASAMGSSISPSTPLIDLLKKPNATSSQVETLLASGVKLDARDKNGDTALIEAATIGNVDCLTTLISKNADVDAQNHDGVNALMKAAYSGKTDCVKLLILHGANVNAKDNKGDTALIKSAFWGVTKL